MRLVFYIFKIVKFINTYSCFLFLQFFCGDVFAQHLPLKQIDAIPLQTPEKKTINTLIFAKKLLAVVFISPECPLCANYTLTLNKLQQKFNTDLDIVGIVAGKSYSLKEVAAFKKKYGVGFMLAADTSKATVKIFKATVTPQVFLLNKERTVLYQGAIDNWAIDLGKQRNKPTQVYMEDAITNYLSGLPIAVKETKPIGCFINDL